MTHEAERWLPVPGWEGLYEVSSYGKVRSLHGRSQKKPLLRPSKGPRGYKAVTLYRPKEKTGTRTPIHRLVMLAFVGPDPERPYVNHKDRNQGNNWLGNLEWCTHTENMRHAHATGYGGGPIGEAHPFAKLNPEKVRVIRRCREYGLSVDHIAQVFGISHSSAYGVATRVTWKHVRHPGEECAA